jgi:MFS superfamily sulfate permease-like transporter
MPPPPPHRLHWIPVDPSWLVSVGLVLLAVLPHQVPATFRRAMRAPLGAILFGAATVWVWTMKPVLGIAMGIFLAAMVIYVGRHEIREGFSISVKADNALALSYEIREGFHNSTPTLIRDRVPPKSHRWFQEVVMQEKPAVIQERTESGRITVDTVTEHDATPWHDEPYGAPHAIQERAAPDHSLAEHDEDMGARD